MSRPLPRATLAVPCAALACLALAACGGSSSGNPSASTPADSALQFARCMRAHGVQNFPDPESGPNGATRFKLQGGPGKLSVSPQTIEAAQNACKRFREAKEPKLTPQQKVAMEEGALKFARCMRTHGVNVHVSTAGGGISIGIRSTGNAGGPNPESPAFQAAQKECQGLLPFKGAGPRAGG